MSYSRNDRRRKAKATKKLRKWRSRGSMLDCLMRSAQRLGQRIAQEINKVCKSMQKTGRPGSSLGTYVYGTRTLPTTPTSDAITQARISYAQKAYNNG